MHNKMYKPGNSNDVEAIEFSNEPNGTFCLSKKKNKGHLHGAKEKRERKKNLALTNYPFGRKKKLPGK